MRTYQPVSVPRQASHAERKRGLLSDRPLKAASSLHFEPAITAMSATEKRSREGGSGIDDEGPALR
jgi:hypothetical protein